MKKEAVLWIDHRRSVIVVNHDQGVKIKWISSTMEKHIRYSGASHASNASAAHPDTTEDGRDRHFGDQLNRYYDKVISYLLDATSILIMGPGEAKIELQNRLGDQGLCDRIVALKTADQMTDDQIAAKLQRFFQESHNGSNRTIYQQAITKEA
jgi:hypothetical protein